MTQIEWVDHSLRLKSSLLMLRTSKVQSRRYDTVMRAVAYFFQSFGIFEYPRGFVRGAPMRIKQGYMRRDARTAQYFGFLPSWAKSIF